MFDALVPYWVCQRDNPVVSLTESRAYLASDGCGFKKAFWAEADMQVYLAENWSRLRQACTHPSVTVHQSTLS